MRQQPPTGLGQGRPGPAGTKGWTSGYALAPIAGALLALVALVLVERRAASPVLPPSLLAMVRVRAALLAAAVSCFAFFGAMYLLGMELQHTQRLSPLDAGLAMLPLTFPVCVMPFFTGRLVARFGARPVLITGMSATALAGVLLAFGGGQHIPLPLIVAAELALAATGTLSIPGAGAAMAVAAPPEFAATSQGALNGIRQGGSALGVAVLGTLGSLQGAGFILIALGLLAVALITRGTAGNRH